MGVSLLGTEEKPRLRTMPWNQRTEQGDGAKGLDMAPGSAMKDNGEASWETGKDREKKEGKPRETQDRLRAAGLKPSPAAAVKATLITPSHPQPLPWF